MTKNKETSYKEAGNSVTFQVYKYVLNCCPMHHHLCTHELWAASNCHTFKFRLVQRLEEECINMYWIAVKDLLSLLLFHRITVSLVLTSLYIYDLCIWLSKVKNSHHLRDIRFLTYYTSLLLIPTKKSFPYYFHFVSPKALYWFFVSQICSSIEHVCGIYTTQNFSMAKKYNQ
jgi:hypothetical protein